MFYSLRNKKSLDTSNLLEEQAPIDLIMLSRLVIILMTIKMVTNFVYIVLSFLR